MGQFSPLIENNVIESLSCSVVFCFQVAAPILRKNLISGNAQAGIIMNAGAAPVIINNTFVAKGCGIATYLHSRPTITNNIIVSNGTGILGSGGHFSFGSSLFKIPP